jgi:hypothetical protein
MLSCRENMYLSIPRPRKRLERVEGVILSIVSFNIIVFAKVSFYPDVPQIYPHAPAALRSFVGIEYLFLFYSPKGFVLSTRFPRMALHCQVAYLFPN